MHNQQNNDEDAAPQAAEQPQAESMSSTDYIYDLGQETEGMPTAGGIDLTVGDTDLLGVDQEQICRRCQELEEQHLRTLAEMDNFKKRLTREKEEQARYAAEAVLADILPALDNFDLALAYGRNNDAYKDLMTGLELAQKSLLETLARHGLAQVGEVGDAFNPEVHEALTQEPNAEIPAGHISQIFQKGYTLKGRIVRPAKVIVSGG